MMHVRGLAVVCAAVLLAFVVAPATASAHARYKSSVPGKSEVVATVPTEVEVTFTEEIQKIARAYSMNVTDSTDAVVSAGPAVINEQDRTTMSVPLLPGLAPGRYVVHWNNVSDADGDPFSGAFAFYVATEPTAADRAADAALEAAEAPEATNTAAPAATAASTQRPSTATASPAASPTPADGGGDGGNGALSAGLIVVVVAVVVVVGGLVFYWNRRGAAG